MDEWDEMLEDNFFKHDALGIYVTSVDYKDTPWIGGVRFGSDINWYAAGVDSEDNAKLIATDLGKGYSKEYPLIPTSRRILTAKLEQVPLKMFSAETLKKNLYNTFDSFDDSMVDTLKDQSVIEDLQNTLDAWCNKWIGKYNVYHLTNVKSYPVVPYDTSKSTKEQLSIIKTPVMLRKLGIDDFTTGIH